MNSEYIKNKHPQKYHNYGKYVVNEKCFISIGNMTAHLQIEGGNVGMTIKQNPPPGCRIESTVRADPLDAPTLVFVLTIPQS